MVRVADGAACPVVAGPLRTVDSVVLFFKVLGSIRVVVSSRQLDVTLVDRKETLRVAIR